MHSEPTASADETVDADAVTPCAPEALSPRAERKCAQLLEGAREIILARGFEGATVDDIARQAGVSKATMYRYYPDKAAIFAAVMQRNCGQQACAMQGVVTEDRPIADVLTDLGERYAKFVLTPDAIRMFRTAVAESERFPVIGEAFFNSGPDLSRAALAPILLAAAARGEIAVDDVDLAAQRFLVLCKAELFFKQLFGIVERYDDAEIAAHVRGAVAAFLRMYRPD